MAGRSSYRHLSLKPGHGHVRPASLPQSWLGHRVTRAGHDVGPKAIRRFRKRLPGLLRGDEDHLERVLTSWRGVVTF